MLTYIRPNQNLAYRVLWRASYWLVMARLYPLATLVMRGALRVSK